MVIFAKFVFQIVCQIKLSGPFYTVAVATTPHPLYKMGSQPQTFGGDDPILVVCCELNHQPPLNGFSFS